MTPPPFTRFVRWLGVDLEAGQLAYARVAFDGVDPCDLPLGERELARELFGPVERIPAACRDVVCAVFGGRGGKTFLGALRLLHLAFTVPIAHLATGEKAFGYLIAPDLDLSAQGIDYALGAVRRRPELSSCLVASSRDSLVLRRNKTQLVVLKAKAASGRGRSGRGKNLVGVVLDESAFFLDASYVVNDEQIFNAVAPRVMPGGQVLVQSTPWGRTGLLHQLYADNWGRPQTCIAAHASTRKVRSNADQLRKVDAEYKRDPLNAAREFGAEFLDNTEQFLPSDDVTACARHDTRLAPNDAEHAATIDPALRSNAFTLAIGRLDADGRLEVALARQWMPEPGKPLRLRDVASDVCAELARYGVTTVTSDGWSGDAIADRFEEHGVALQRLSLSPEDTANAWTDLRQAVERRRISLPGDDQVLKDLRSVRRLVRSGGRLSFDLPVSRDGRHADYAPALLRLSVTAKRLARPVDEDAARAEREKRRRARDEEDQYEAKLLERQSADWRRSKGNDAWIRTSNS